jgi:uncharacterized membrane protein
LHVFRFLERTQKSVTSVDFAVGQLRAIAGKLPCLFGRDSREKSARQSIEYPERYRGLIVSKAGSDSVCIKPLLADWAESFIFAGSSALFLLFANLFPNSWYFSFFALVPFLLRTIKASPGESLRLGFLFGLSFFTVSVIDSLTISPVSSVLKLLSGIGLFALFGWAVGYARNRWGFNPSIVAVLWVGLEVGLVKLGFVSGIFGKAEFSHPLLHGMVGLFGFLVASAIIVLLNSLLVLAIVKTIELTRSKGKTLKRNERIWQPSFTRNFFTEKVYIVPEGRAPPVFSL